MVPAAGDFHAVLIPGSVSDLGKLPDALELVHMYLLLPATAPPWDLEARLQAGCIAYFIFRAATAFLSSSFASTRWLMMKAT